MIEREIMKRYNVIIFMGESHLVCLNKTFHSHLSSFLVIIESVSLKISISSSRIDNGRVKYFYHFLPWLP